MIGCSLWHGKKVARVLFVSSPMIDLTSVRVWGGQASSGFPAANSENWFSRREAGENRNRGKPQGNRRLRGARTRSITGYRNLVSAPKRNDY